MVNKQDESKKQITSKKDATQKQIAVKKVASKKVSDKKLKVTWVKSSIGYKKSQHKIIEALGFKRLNQTRILPDNDSIRGSIFHIKHLVKVEEI